MVDEVFVFAHIDGDYVPAGKLKFIAEAGERTCQFAYGTKYSSRDGAFPIDPVNLPLGTRETIQPPQDFELFPAMRDSMPDSWGKHLLEKEVGRALPGESYYLLATGSGRVGALAYGPNVNAPLRLKPSARRNADEWVDYEIDGEAVSIEDLVTAADEIDSIDRLDRKFSRFVRRGSSLGGARPKAAARYKGREWIAKFQRQDDTYNQVRAEYATMKLAQGLGLIVPNIDLIQVLGKDVFLIERFDREVHGNKLCRLPFVSAQTLLNLHEQHGLTVSYAEIADAVSQYGEETKKDRRNLFERMVFNILCGNTDDHLRNHGFLWNRKGWSLSPLYDVVPQPQDIRDRGQSLVVGQDGYETTLGNALSDCGRFGLKSEEAFSTVEKMQKYVRSNWEAAFSRAGFSNKDREYFTSCFAQCDEIIKPASQQANKR